MNIESQNAWTIPSNGIVLPTYIDCRRNLLAQWLDLSQWKKLEQKIADFNPDIIIYLARKMPRISELLQWRFPNAIAVSDFAIPWIADKIAGKRVAIVDDTVCMGSTLRQVTDFVDLCLPEARYCFAIAKRKRQDNETLDDFLEGLPVEYSSDEEYEKDRYLEFSYWLAKSLRLLAKPYELEFPVYTIPYGKEIDQNWQILVSLQNRFGKSCVHSTSTDENLDDTGLLRLTVDMFPDSVVNYKIRLYLDDDKKLARYVPMASLHENFCSAQCADLQERCERRLASINPELETFDGETEFRCRQYIASLDFGISVLGQFKNILDLSSISLEVDDANKLFGPDFAKILKDAKLVEVDGNLTCTHIQPKHCEETSQFYEIISKEPAQSKLYDALKKNTSDLTSNSLIFQAFFKSLAECVGERGLREFQLPELLDNGNVTAKPYKRLRIGATFGDLVKIFGDLWNENNPKLLRHEVSRLLDQCIDNGCVVPVISSDLKRVYRKGEAPLFDVTFLSLAKLISDRANLPKISPYSCNAIDKWTEEAKDTLKQALTFSDTKRKKQLTIAHSA